MMNICLSLGIVPNYPNAGGSGAVPIGGEPRVFTSP